MIRATAVLLALAGAALAQDPGVPSAPDAADASVTLDRSDGALTLRVRLDTPSPALGAPVGVRMEADVAGDPSAIVVWPDLRSALLDALGEETAEVETERVAADGRSLDAVLRFWDEGKHALPELTVRARREAAGGGDPEQLGAVTVDALVFEVTSPVPADAEPAPPREGIALVPPPAPFPWLLVGLGAAALLAIVAALIWLRRRPKPVVPPPPPPPPHERALAALRALASRGLVESGDVEPYFVELSEILRRYLEDRFGLRAPEQTTEEFLADVSRTDAGRRALEAAQRDVLREFLTRADLVKFARATPSLDECRSAGDTAERFVRETAVEPGPNEPALPSAVPAASGDES